MWQTQLLLYAQNDYAEVSMPKPPFQNNALIQERQKTKVAQWRREKKTIGRDGRNNKIAEKKE